MPKGRTKFTKNLRKAVQQLTEDEELGLKKTRSWSLYSPVFRGDYKWAKLMDSDGLLIGPRSVKKGEGAEPRKEVNLLTGVVIQSEDSTSQTKPNPYGKAAIVHTPYGTWIDLANGERVRIDRVRVLFVLPKGAPPKQQKKFETAKRNVKNAADSMPDAEYLETERGITTSELVAKLKDKVRPWFKGRGRPAKKKGPK